MQKAITFHPNQTIMLIKEQKRLIHILNSMGGVIFPVYPLWIFLTDPEFEMLSQKEIATFIKSLKIEGASVCDSHLVFPVKMMTYNNTLIKEKLVAARIKKMPSTPAITNDFSIECTIFKISEALHNEISHSYTLWNPIWHKTRH